MSDAVYAYRQLERELDPSVVGRVVEEIRVAHSAFPLRRVSVDRYVEMTAVVTAYVQHMLVRVYRLSDYPIEEAYDRAVELMRQGNMSFDAVYDDCHRGIDGGVSTVLNKICEVIERERVHFYTDRIYRKYIEDPGDVLFIEQLMDEFVRHYGKFLPFPMKERTALVMHHRQIIFQFPLLISRMRGMVGK